MAEYDESTHTAIKIEDYNKLKASEKRLGTTESKLQDQITETETLKASYADLEKKKQPKQGATKEEREEIEQLVRQELGEKLTATEKQKAELETRLKALTVTDRVMGALGDKVVPSAKKWLRQEIEKECDIDGDLSDPTVVVKDEKGNVRWSAKKPDQKMDVAEYTEVLQSRYPEFFASSAKPGEKESGTKTDGSTPAYVGQLSWDKISGMSDAELAAVPDKDLKNLLNM